MHDTLHLLVTTNFPPIRRGRLETLQVNLGYKCNQSCLHCHVNAGPNRTEMMDAEHAALVLQVLQALQPQGLHTLDLTGGAPELSPHFKTLVSGARALGVRVIDRCNLTILSEPGQEDLAAFLAHAEVEVTASLPCYSPANVDRQRGDGVFDRSIAGLRQLNALGYGRAGSGLVLNLVYNPQGPSLPPAQGPLEADYKRELLQHFGIHFNHLFALTNMPIQRFGSTLVSKGTFATYMQLLRGAYKAENLATVMCRSTVSVDWQGDLYDCDFNQMLGLRARLGAGERPPLAHRPHRPHHPHLRDLLPSAAAPGVQGQAIATADHCYGCTAGQGSSCGGALGAVEDGPASAHIPIAVAPATPPQQQPQPQAVAGS